MNEFLPLFEVSLGRTEDLQHDRSDTYELLCFMLKYVWSASSDIQTSKHSVAS